MDLFLHSKIIYMDENKSFDSTAENDEIGIGGMLSDVVNRIDTNNLDRNIHLNEEDRDDNLEDRSDENSDGLDLPEDSQDRPMTDSEIHKPDHSTGPQD